MGSGCIGGAASSCSPHEFTLRKTINMSTLRRRSQEEFYKESVEEFLERKSQKRKIIEEQVKQKEEG
jgi:hypothetical protein